MRFKHATAVISRRAGRAADSWVNNFDGDLTTTGAVAVAPRFSKAATRGGVLMERGAVVHKSIDVNEAERVLIGRALEASGGSLTTAAELRGMSVRTLRNERNGMARGRRTTGRRRCASRCTVELVRATVEFVRATVELVR